MNFPSDLPKLPKWIFLAGDAALLATAWGIGHNTAHPYAGAALWAIVILVVLAVVVGAYPFLAEDARKYDQALDDRQKALQVLADTVAKAADQVSIAATGLNTIAEAAQENFRKSEALTGQLAGHIAEFDRRLGGAGGAKPEGGAASEGDTRIDAAVKKITRVATALEVTLTKTVEAARTMTPFSAAAAPSSTAAPMEAPPVLASQMVEIRPVLPKSDDSMAPIPAPQAVPASAPASAADTTAPLEQLAEPAPPPPPPRKRGPRKSAPPPPPAPVGEAITEAPAPAAKVEISPTAAPAPVEAEPIPVPAAPIPEPTAAVDTVPPLSFGAEDEAMDEDFTAPAFEAAPPAATMPADEAPAPKPAAEATAVSAPPPAEPARSSDGATRLVVTAYIGIGNRLFIRGDGPGLSWDRGVPLTFVSIGKWRWETNEAAKAIRFRLFKNDTVECTALGEKTVEPGAQQELSASF